MAEPNEPNHAGSNVRRTLWWRWQAPAEGDLQLKAYGENFQGAVAVYVNAALPNLVKIGERVTTDVVTLPIRTVAGRIYQIAVDGYAGLHPSRGNFRFDLDFTPAPVVGRIAA